MRGSGILMHITSLPSDNGIGTLGKAAYEFADFLKKSGQSYWQILPVNPTGFGDSPYQALSAFAGNPYLIDLDILCEEGLLKAEEYRDVDWGSDETSVDYGRLFENRISVLKNVVVFSALKIRGGSTITQDLLLSRRLTATSRGLSGAKTILKAKRQSFTEFCSFFFTNSGQTSNATSIRSA